MNPGELRHRVTIQAPTGTTQNECSEDVPTYVDFATVWAAVEPLRGREYFEAQKIRPEMQYRVRMRYLAGVTTDMQVIYRGKILDIQSVINVDERDAELHLMCLERIQNA